MGIFKRKLIAESFVLKQVHLLVVKLMLTKFVNAHLIKRIDKPLITYGIENKDVDIKAENIQQKNGNVSFDVKVKNKILSVNLSVPGKYNVYNALAALSVCETMGINIEKACKALSDFSGVKRRFDIKVNKKVMIVDDYACLLYTSPSPRD